jgi:hypothetical protein
LPPDSAVHRLLDRPLPCTKDFLPRGFSQAKKTSKEL